MDGTTLQLWGVIGTWVASIGTVSAVVASLWLAYRQNKIDLKISAGLRVAVTPGNSETEDYCLISVVNVGSRTVKLSGIGWEAGWFRKKISLYQKADLPEGDTIPKQLYEGEDATFLIPFKQPIGDGFWIDSIANKLSESNPKKLNSLKVVIATSAGQTFKVKVEKEFVKEMKKYVSEKEE